MRGLADRLGIGEGREIEPRLLRAGIDRCGVGREIDLDGARLGVGAGRVACLLLCCLA